MRGRNSLAVAKIAQIKKNKEVFKCAEDGGPAQILNLYLNNQTETENAFASLSPTNVNLILKDGIIPVHAAVLCAVSPFFRLIFETQGLNCLESREILMPDFTIALMKKVVKLIYDDHVYIAKEREGQEIVKILKMLEVNSDGKINSARTSKSELAKQREVEIRTQSKDSTTERGPESEAAEDNSVDFADEATEKVTSDDTSSDSGDSSSDSDYGPRGKGKKRRGRKRKSNSKTVTFQGKKMEIKDCTIPVVKLNEKSTATVSKSNSVCSEVLETKTDNENEHEPDGEVERPYKNPQWLEVQAKTCQKCNTKYDNAALASGCMSRHGRLRCYFCFRVYLNTEKLFEHFQRAHKKAGRENFVLCPICDQSIPYKSVSCHVISLHLVTDDKMKGNKLGSGRPSQSLIASKTILPPAKRPKLADVVIKENDLKVGSLDCTIHHDKRNGKTWVFSFKKIRP